MDETYIMTFKGRQLQHIYLQYMNYNGRRRGIGIQKMRIVAL